MNFFLYLTLIFLYLFDTSKVYAYSNFIAYGYKSCSACHYNPFGAGPLNDYGRALSATAISGKTLYPNASEEQVTSWSGALGPAKLPDWFRPSADYRTMRWAKEFGEPTSESLDIEMNAELNVVLKWGDRDKFHYSFSISRYPVSDDSASANTQDEWISRENYAAYKINDEFKIQAGIFDIVYGLRVPDHIAFSKTLTGLAQNDQTIGSAAHFRKDAFEGGFHLFTGNLNEDSDERQSGISGMFEYSINPNIHLGLSGLTSGSDYLKKNMFAFHGRAAFGKGSSLIGEVGTSTYTPDNTNFSEEKNIYFFSQSMMRLFRGLHFVTTFEFNSQTQSASETTSYRFGPGLQWFPIQRLEIKSEFYNDKVVSNTSSSNDSWNWFTNLHLYF